MTDSASRRSVILRTALPLGVLAMGIAGYVGLVGLASRPPSSPLASPPPAVDTTRPARLAGKLDLDIDGTVEPFRVIDVAAEVGGRIKYKGVECRAGRYVDPAPLLIEIDPRDYKLEVRRLERELSQALVMLEELDVEVSNLDATTTLASENVQLERKNLARVRGLFKRGVATEAALDAAQRPELAARMVLVERQNQSRLLMTRRRRFESSRDLFAARLESAQLDLDRTRVFSPVAGVITRDLVEAGEYVQKGSPLFAVEDTSAVEVRCSLRVDELYWLWNQAAARARRAAEKGAAVATARRYEIPRTPVTVIYQLAGREYSWEGVLERYEGIGLDTRTRTAPCRVSVSDPRSLSLQEGEDVVGPPALVRGMYVRVRLHVDAPGKLLVVDDRAIQPGSPPTVWVVRDKRLKRLSVRIVTIDEGQVVIDPGSSGLAINDHVVVSPLTTETEGIEVSERFRRGSNVIPDGVLDSVD